MRNMARHCLEHNQRQCVSAGFEEGQQSLMSEYMNWNPYPNVSREKEQKKFFVGKKKERSVDRWKRGRKYALITIDQCVQHPTRWR